MKDDYTTNSHYLTYTFLYMVGRTHSLNLGVKGLIGWPIIEKSVRDSAAGMGPG